MALLQVTFHYLTNFFKAFHIKFSRKAKELNAQVASAVPLVSILVHEDDHPNLIIFKIKMNKLSTHTKGLSDNTILYLS